VAESGDSETGAPSRATGEEGAAPAGETVRTAARSAWRILASRGFWLLLVLVAVAFGISRGIEAAGGPEALRTRFGAFAPVASALIHAPLAATPFPSEVFAISHGALYGFWVGAVVGWVGWVLGSLIEYLVLLRWRTEVLGRELRITWPGWLARLPMDHPAFLIGARQLPWGYHLVNVMAAATGVPFMRHLWCSLVSQIPTALLIAAVGVGILELDL